MKKLSILLYVFVILLFTACSKYSIIYNDEYYKKFLENYKKYHEVFTIPEIVGFKPLINMEFNYGTNFNGEHTFVKHNENLFAISDNGELKMCFKDLSSHEIKNDYAVYKQANRYGVDDIFGNNLHNANFNEYFIKGDKLMLLNKRDAAIYQRDKLISSTKFTANISLINENVVLKDNTYYDLNFNPFTYKSYTIASAPSDGMMIIFDTNTFKFGYISKDESIFIEPKFSYANDFINGYARVGDGENSIIINKNGEVLYSSTTVNVKNYHNGYFVFESNNMRGVMDNNFKTVIQPIFTSIMSDMVYGDYIISGNPAQVYSISKGNFLSITYDSIVAIDKKFIVLNNNKYSILDYNLNTIVSDCDGLGYFNKILSIQKEDKFTYYKEVLL